jgi:DtxR family transcriptional regulator, Mn-dependent transcriptional regulator
VVEARGQPLATILPGQQVIVQRVNDDHPDLLRYLAELGLIPGALVQVQAVAPYGGVYTVRIGEQVHAVGDAVTQAVLVRPVTPDPVGEPSPSSHPQGEHA